jgi:hypothetical protein
MENVSITGPGRMFSRKNNLTLLKTTINPTSRALRKVLGQKTVKLLVITDNARIAQLAYDHVQQTPGDNRQLIWVPKTRQTTLHNAIPGLPGDLRGIDALALSTENKIAAMIQADDPVTYDMIGQLYSTASELCMKDEVFSHEV